MHITTRSLLAVKTLLCCAAEPNRQFRKHEVALLLNASENHLAQVIHQLAQRGFLTTTRGRSGGLRLARPAAQITLGQILRQFEGELPLIDAEAQDGLAHVLHKAEAGFYTHLDQITLAALLMPDSDRPALSMAAE
jgi:Rrf2 family transcriptional regulator, nitric oxide-sensitive transcriptional repressor